MVQKKRALIITADDFGLHQRVNDAVVQAHSHGILTTASLMVAAPAMQHAVECARQLPQLAVGLHLVLADGVSMLPASQIPDLVDETGRFSDQMAKNGARFFFLPHVKRQLKCEIRAQFEAFAQTGLKLDHVNAHKHFHVHPTILSFILEIGQEYGLRAVRLPAEKQMSFFLKPWIQLVKWRLKRAGIFFNDYVFGIGHTGKMDESTWLNILSNLPKEGVGEIYCHPAVAGESPITQSMRDYRHQEELNALLSLRVQSTLKQLAIPTAGFAEIAQLNILSRQATQSL